MSTDINAYEIFLKGKFNPIAFTTFDKSAIRAEKRFNHQVKNYVESHSVVIKVDANKIYNDPSYLQKKLLEYNFKELGFQNNEKVIIEYDTDNIDESNKIEVYIKSESKGEVPNLSSKKLIFYDELRDKVKERVKKTLRKESLKVENEERLKLYINQQYQFGINFLKQLYKRIEFIHEYGEPIERIGKVKRPNETNSLIISFIISDLFGILNFIENNYGSYLHSNPIDIKEFEKQIFLKKKAKSNSAGTRWKKWFDIQLLELKPNIAGLGINFNEIIKRMKKS
jgi:hypothetical protein